MISFFNVNAEDSALIVQIVERASAMMPVNPVHLAMDITACHANGCPLKLKELLAARKGDFVHDVFGINRHINRETGKLENCFLPRFYDHVAAFNRTYDENVRRRGQYQE